MLLKKLNVKRHLFSPKDENLEELRSRFPVLQLNAILIVLETGYFKKLGNTYKVNVRQVFSNTRDIRTLQFLPLVLEPIFNAFLHLLAWNQNNRIQTVG